MCRFSTIFLCKIRVYLTFALLFSDFYLIEQKNLSCYNGGVSKVEVKQEKKGVKDAETRKCKESL